MQSIFVPKADAPPLDKEEWIQKMVSIMDMNMENESELYLL